MVDTLGNIEHAVDAGAAALVKGGVVCDPVTGDVLYDYDWTPIEAARVVLEAVNYEGAVEALREIHRVLGGGEWDVFPEVVRAVELAAPYSDATAPNKRKDADAEQA